MVVSIFAMQHEAWNVKLFIGDVLVQPGPTMHLSCMSQLMLIKFRNKAPRIVVDNCLLVPGIVGTVGIVSSELVPCTACRLTFTSCLKNEWSRIGLHQ